jgi:carbon storage regulator
MRMNQVYVRMARRKNRIRLHGQSLSPPRREAVVTSSPGRLPIPDSARGLPLSAEQGSFRRTSRLVLSRYEEQSIMIGNDIEIRVIAVKGEKVTLGIEAPRQTPVHRRELFDRVARRSQTHVAKPFKKALHKAG